MIEIRAGNILDADAEALVNTVNCVGVMGRGVALQFRKAYPDNFKEYEAACKHGDVVPGKMLIHFRGTLTWPRYIINFPTKTHWKGKSRIEFIDSGLAALTEDVRRLNISSIAIPPLGCGLGGLRWSDVRPRVESAFGAMPNVKVYLFEPSGAPVPEIVPMERKQPRMTMGSAVLIHLMQQYLAALMDPTVTLLEIHKLMYFMQEAGQALDLRYEKGAYGPYASNLRHLLVKIDRYFISGYGDGEDSPTKPVELLPSAIEPATQMLKLHKETERRLERVSDLISGFESPYGLELLATLHWVMKRDGATNIDDAISMVYQWNNHKRMLKDSHIRIAYNALHEHGWITA